MNEKHENYDVIIIGAGAVGCAVARELSRYELRIAVLEKNSDVAGETTGRNSAVVHAGFNNAPGSTMASLCVEGNEGFEELCRQLDVPYRRTGKLLLAFDDEDAQRLEQLLQQGRANGCRGLKILEHEALKTFLREHDMEALAGESTKRAAKDVKQQAPDAEFGAGKVRCALWSPQTAITNPFLYCVALAENAVANGARVFLNTKVTGIRRMEDAYAGFEVKAEEASCGACDLAVREKVLRCRYLINCAGLQADRISAMAGADRYRIYPCRGEYFILDKNPLAMPVYPVPRKDKGGLGVHLTPTMDGNIIIGPSAEYLKEDDTDAGKADTDAGRRCDYACTQPVMEELMRQAKQLMPAIAEMQPIGNYSGIRPKLSPPQRGGYRDFVICEEENVPGLINLIGIESPGLTASVPIARRVCRILERSACKGASGLRKKRSFRETRTGILRFRQQNSKRQAELIAQEPDYGEIICRCQKITKREIRQAIENPLGARSLTAIKYRAWATTGRCSGGYCLPKIASILIEEYGLRPEDIRYRDPGSEMFTGYVK